MEITCRPADSDVWETLNREKIRQQIRWETVKHHEESTGGRIHDWARLEALKAPFVQKVEEDSNILVIESINASDPEQRDL